jgi:hypothetical protein
VLIALGLQEGAYADVVVKLGLIKLLTKRFDVCEELYAFPLTFPCSLGSFADLFCFRTQRQCPLEPSVPH